MITMLRLAAILTVTVLLSWASSEASNVVSPLNPPCFQIGQANGCDVTITINAAGIASLSLTGQPAYDGAEDALVGVINNSAVTINSLALTGSDIFGFDGDGAFTGLASQACIAGGANTFGCGPGPNGPSGYEGPLTHFVVTNINSGTVFFDGGGIAPGGTSQFSLEEAPTTAINVIVNPSVPSPSSGVLFLLGSGVVSLSAALRRRRHGADQI
jgi:hypothetical protein